MTLTMLWGTRCTRWVAVVNAERLVGGVLPVEVDQVNHIEVLIELLKSTLEPWDLCRFPSCVCVFIKECILRQAVLLNVLIMVSHVDVTAELGLRVIVIDTSVLGIDAFVDSPQHHCQR